ncbi:MAG: fluoride efflux transporter CrcB [Chloroflexi bacterium]|nr:fluoride efflux transporter CrcB [Chloroflexota bacterium]
MFLTRRQVETFLIIGLGGFIGANLRYIVSGWATERFGNAFPWGTLLINFSGSCLLAVFVGWATNHPLFDPRVRLLIAVGFFGAYTTFSTYATESLALLQAGDWIGAVGNVLGTNLICILGALLGLAVGGRL